jgi:uncharacterized protein YacL
MNITNKEIIGLLILILILILLIINFNYDSKVFRTFLFAIITIILFYFIIKWRLKDIKDIFQTSYINISNNTPQSNMELYAIKNPKIKTKILKLIKS